VVAGGTSERVLVSGYSGIEKSSVVNELHKELVPPTLSNSRTRPKVVQREAGALAGREPAEFSASVTAKTALIPLSGAAPRYPRLFISCHGKNHAG